MKQLSLLTVLRAPALALAFTATALAIDVGPNDVYIRVVDVGSGLCTVTEVPGGHYMVYDAGHWNGKKCLQAVDQIVDGNKIDLMIISHSDADHLGDGDDILKKYQVHKIITTGFVRTSANWKKLNKEIGEEAKKGATVINLQTSDLVPGTEFSLGNATVTLVAGLPEWTLTNLDESESRNVISIVARLDYEGGSVLFSGNTVGRRKDDDPPACKDAEKVMVDRHDAGEVSLESDVMIAPHHGGNNGSATCFIDKVDPEFVIFSAGHQYQHPTKAAAERYKDEDVEEDKIFRTDRGDDESGSFEWKKGKVSGCKDKKGDDDVEIVLKANGTVLVEYRQASSGC